MGEGLQRGPQAKIFDRAQPAASQPWSPKRKPTHLHGVGLAGASVAKDKEQAVHALEEIGRQWQGRTLEDLWLKEKVVERRISFRKETGKKDEL